VQIIATWFLDGVNRLTDEHRTVRRPSPRRSQIVVLNKEACGQRLRAFGGRFDDQCGLVSVREREVCIVISRSGATLGSSPKTAVAQIVRRQASKQRHLPTSTRVDGVGVVDEHTTNDQRSAKPPGKADRSAAEYEASGLSRQEFCDRRRGAVKTLWHGTCDTAPPGKDGNEDVAWVCRLR